MDKRWGVLALIFCTILAALCAEEVLPPAVGIGPGFSLLPALETALNGDLRWRPDWPADFPPDGFSLSHETPAASGIILSDGYERSFRLQRDGRGRLVEFPLYAGGAWFSVTAAYDPRGALQRLSIVPSETGDSLVFEFPPDFYFYGDISPGAIFPPVKASSGGAEFFLFFFESSAVLSETWYDEQGNLLAYHKAAVQRENRAWHILSLTSWNAQGIEKQEYSFDSSGNVSGIFSSAGTYTALYLNRRPLYREQNQAGEQTSSGLQWDERGFLVRLHAAEAALEYRYEYTTDKHGNWTSRRDIAITGSLGVYIPRPGQEWKRSISYGGIEGGSF